MYVRIHCIYLKSTNSLHSIYVASECYSMSYFWEKSTVMCPPPPIQPICHSFNDVHIQIIQSISFIQSILFKFWNLSSIAAVIGWTIQCGSASGVWIIRRWNKWHLLPSSGNLSFHGSASGVWIMRRWNKWHLLPSSGNLSFQRGFNK